MHHLIWGYWFHRCQESQAAHYYYQVVWPTPALLDHLLLGSPSNAGAKNLSLLRCKGCFGEAGTIVAWKPWLPATAARGAGRYRSYQIHSSQATWATLGLKMYCARATTLPLVPQLPGKLSGPLLLLGKLGSNSAAESSASELSSHCWGGKSTALRLPGLLLSHKINSCQETQAGRCCSWGRLIVLEFPNL